MADSVRMIFSFGVVPFWRQGHQLEYLLIQNRGTYHWSFPKGHRESGESALQAAEREMGEETGIRSVKIISSATFSERYSFGRKGALRHKTVTFYLGRVRRKRLTLQREEIQRAQWLPFASALRLPMFPNTKRILEQANTFLHRYRAL